MAHDDVMAEMGEVRLPLDLEKLGAYITASVRRLPGSRLQAKQFSTGTSNPTYLVWSEAEGGAAASGGRFVLRRKPPGKLLPGAHQIDREYKVMAALHGAAPVPEVFAFCDDAGVIGAPFYLMECVAGRVLGQDGGASLQPEERTQLWDSVCEAVAALHSVDYRAVGLEGYGKTGDFAARQVKTWGRNFDKADEIVHRELKRPELTADMRELRDYLLAGMAILEPEPTCVVHGDIGLHNMLIHPTKPQVAAILDWEISTLGHPLIDVDYIAAALPGGWRTLATREFAQQDTSGVPTAREFIEAYFRRRKLPMVSEQVLNFASLVNMFRFAAIVHGVLARGMSGNAASGTTRNQTMELLYIGVLRHAVSQMRSAQGGSGGSGAASARL